ncbi:MAG: hypothetical protein FJY29_08205 [Betaproteobacteria bacterium]|nr:hypothetical protein [Betaproteobacteria bacterium]
MNHPVIEALTQLEFAAAEQFWNSEDRSAWKEDLLRQSETLTLVSLKKFITPPAGEEKPTRTQVPVFPATIWDSDLRQCFYSKSVDAHEASEPDTFQIALSRLTQSDAGTLMGVMLRPGFWMNETWADEEDLLRNALKAAREKQTLVFRTGFFTHPADILLAADLGFTGIQIHAGQLDLYELQMAIELARDCKLCPVVSVSTEAEMEQVVQTDAPHIALCSFPGEGQDASLRFVQNALPKIPNNCTRILMTANRSEQDLQLIGRLGFHAIIHFGE